MSEIASVNEQHSMIASYITEVLAKLLKVKPSNIDGSIPFDRLGLDSADAFRMVGSLNQRFATDFEPTVLYEHPTVAELATFVQGHIVR